MVNAVKQMRVEDCHADVRKGCQTDEWKAVVQTCEECCQTDEWKAVMKTCGRLSCRCEEGCHAGVRKAAMLMRRMLPCRCKENFQADQRVVEKKVWREMERVNV